MGSLREAHSCFNSCTVSLAHSPGASGQLTCGTNGEAAASIRGGVGAEQGGHRARQEQQWQRQR